MNTEKELMDSLHISRYQAKLYIAGLQLGQATQSDLARSAGIPRTATYEPLKGLLKRNFITSIKKGKREYYSSIDSKQLVYVLEQDRARLNIAIADLSQSIDSKQSDVSVRHFTGTHGVQAAADIFLNESKSKMWQAVEHPSPVLEKIQEKEFESFIQRRIDKGIHIQLIIPSSSRTQWVEKRIKNAKKELYDILIISDNQYPISSSMAVDEQSVLIFSMQGVPFALIVKNPYIAETFSSMHSMIWDRYH